MGVKVLKNDYTIGFLSETIFNKTCPFILKKP